MASKLKVSENGRRIIIDSKRKIISRAQIVGASNKSLAVKSALNKLGKRKRANECNNKCCSCSRKTFLKNYSNFMKSGIPQRLLFSQDGQWVDFSREVIELVKDGFRSKNAAIEAKLNGSHFMLDILYMIHVDLKTGTQKPIAWIDETGNCVFPELYSSCNGTHELDVGESPEIKLHLEIELIGSSNNNNNNNNNNLEECVGESNFKRVKVDQESQRNASPSRNICRTVDVEMARKMFVTGFCSDLKIEILDVEKCSGGFKEAQLEIFEKQVEITEKLRGKANVQHAWLAASGGAPYSGMVYGFGRNVSEPGRYGYGVHLAAVWSAHHSATICDIDEKGVRHMVLCRVILGNMEELHPGSKQFHPSDQCFDSGVDDLQNPNHYIVWNMNTNTHIYPECKISFKMSPTIEGNPVAEESRLDLSRVTTHDPHGPLHLDSSSSKTAKNCPLFESMKPTRPEKVPSVGSSTPKDPKSPWMPFSMLFEAISAKVAPNDMKTLHIFYESFRAKKMNREEFIRKLRSVAGDQILRSTISSLQSKHVPNSASMSEVKKEVQEL